MKTRIIEVIVCPACARTEVNVEKIGLELEQILREELVPRLSLGASSMIETKGLTIAILGCAVNGPGEAAEADFAIVCAKSKSWIYKSKQRIKAVSNDSLLPEFLTFLQSQIIT